MCAANFVDVISEFPDHSSPDFDQASYVEKYKNSSIIVSASARKLFFDYHWGALSLKTVLRGEEYYVTRHSKYKIVPGNYLILNEGSEYSSYIDSAGQVESFTIHFGPRFVNRFFHSLFSPGDVIPGYDETGKQSCPAFVEKTYFQDDKIRTLLKDLHRVVQSGINNDHFFERNEMDDLLRTLLLSLLTINAGVQVEINSMTAARPSTREEVYRRLNYARDYMESSYGEVASIDQVAKVACMNPEYFIRQFKRQYQVTPAQYLISRRMKAAGVALSSPGASVSSVCRKVGYSDLSSFGKLFKRYFGLSPEAYSRQMQFAD